MKNTKRAFTLIELLVVIAIIGFITSVVMASLISAQRDARDKRRVSDLKQLQTALELYHTDNQMFPTQAGGANGNISTNTTLLTLLEPYLQGTPIDPAGLGDSTYHYYYDGNHLCGGKRLVVIFARQMDKPENANYDTFLNTSCAGSVEGEGRGGGTESYNIIIGSSSG